MTTPKNTYDNGLTTGMVFILAIACGSIVANLYYAQTLIVMIGNHLHLNLQLTGLIVALTQLGYCIGLLFIVPLADVIENKRLILGLLSLMGIFLLIIIFTHTGSTFLLCCFLLGLATVATQVIIPFAAHFTPLEKRGSVIGKITSGLLFGIMFARPMASTMAYLFTWQSIFIFSAVLITLIALVLYYKLPERMPGHKISYKQLIYSLPVILKSYPILQRRAAYHAILFAVFTLFWTSIAMLLLGNYYHYSQVEVALFAFVGAAGALMAPIAGRLADAGHTRIATGGAILMVMLACFLAKWHGGHSIIMLVIAAIILDAGVGGNLVLGQRAIFALVPEVRSRLNGLYMGIFFIGGATGSGLSGYLYAHGAWNYITNAGAMGSVLAFAYFLSEFHHKIN